MVISNEKFKINGIYQRERVDVQQFHPKSIAYLNENARIFP